MKYAVDIIITNKETLEASAVYEEYADKHEAHERREEVMSNMDRETECSDWSKVYPVVKCCREKVRCWEFTNTCPKCGADYNFNGDRLAPRSQWGEETGEHWSDCY